ncbi:MAG: sulfatase-like hydrolase/transferase [Polyangiales bacterium]
MRRLSVLALCLALCDAGGVGCKHDTQTAPVVDAGAKADLPPPVVQSTSASVVLDMMAPSPRCRIEHRGAFVDLGSPEASWSTPGHPDAADLPAFERDGATWGRVLDRSQTFTLAIDESGPALVSVRGRARASKKAIASIDGKLVGTLTLSTTEDKVVTVTNAGLQLTPGVHVVTLRWTGGAKKEEPLAELDWLRAGVADEGGAYAAPIRRDAVAQVALSGAPRKAFTLMAPAVVRCVAWIPKGATLLADVGAIGEGSGGEVEVRERVNGSDAPRVLAKRAASSNAWSGIEAPLGISGEIGVIEIVVTKSPKQGRVAIAEPRIVRSGAAEKPVVPMRAQSAIVVVLAGLSNAHLSLPTLQKLAKEGVTFRGHRAPSHLAAASVASLVTSLPVPVHALEDAAARLSPRTPLVGKTLAPFGVESAMFTEVPTTGAAFGFAHDWTNYAARSPLDGAPVAFDEVGKYLEQHVGKKTFVLAHARGAHPPWDVTPEVFKTLPPEGYSGPIDPKHVVAVIAKARRNLMKLSENDRTRLHALTDVALAAQDKKLDALIESLRANGTLDKTLIVVTGDAPFVIPPATMPAPAASASALVPTPPPPEPAEDPLGIPLIVRFPGMLEAGRVASAVTDPSDVGTTVIAAFGGPLEGLGGRDLYQLALDDERARDTARLSDDGHGYQLVWGDLRLVGSWGKIPVLRPRTAADDLRVKRPFEYLAAWGLAAEARAQWLAARAKGPGREPATIDPATQAALDSWERAR